VPRVDYRAFMGQGQRRWFRGAGAWFNTIDVGMRGWRMMDDDWNLTDQTVAGFVNYTGPYQTQVEFNMPRDIVVYQGERYEYFRPNVFFSIKPSGRTAIRLNGRFGDGVDYANNRKATGVVQFGPAIEYRPVSRVSLQLSYSLDQLSVDGGRLYRANLTQLKMVYHLNVRESTGYRYSPGSREISVYWRMARTNVRTFRW
jgi:hypothetical protein